MTCVVGMVNNGKVWMGGDSSATSDTVRDRVVESKVFHCGPMLIGYADAFRGAQVLRHGVSFAPAMDRAAALDPMRYLVTAFIPTLRTAYDAHGVTPKDHSTFLIGLGGRLFEVHRKSFQVVESVDNFAAIGAGYEFALGAYAYSRFFGFVDAKPADGLIDVLTAVSAYCPTVLGPFTILEST